MSHHHHEECHKETCHEHECCCSCHEIEDPKLAFAQELLELADEAWMELLKEKIKEHIAQTSGKHLDQLAKLVSSSNHARWQSKMAIKRSESEYHEKLCDFFHKK